MDADVDHSIDWLVAGNYRFTVGLHYGRPHAAVVTEDRFVCVDLARAEVLHDAKAAAGEKFLDAVFDGTLVTVLGSNGAEVRLIHFSFEGPTVRRCFDSPAGHVNFPSAIVADGATTSILLHTFSGHYFSSTTKLDAALGVWPEPTPCIEEISQDFIVSQVGLVTDPVSRRAYCALAYSLPPCDVLGGEVTDPFADGWSDRASAVSYPRQLDTEAPSAAHLEDLRCLVLGDRPVLVLGSEGALEVRDLETGDLVSARVLGSGPESGDECRVYSVDIIGGLVALLLEHSIEVRDLDSFEVIDRIQLGPQTPKTRPDLDPARYPSRHAVRLLETGQGLIVVWLEDRAIRARAVRRPLPARVSPTVVPRGVRSLDVGPDGTLIAWIDGDGIPWALAGAGKAAPDGPPEPQRAAAGAAWDVVFAGSPVGQHPVLLARYSGEWALPSRSYALEPPALEGREDDVVDAAFSAGRFWALSLLGRVMPVGGKEGPRWDSRTNRSLLVSADWALVEAIEHSQSSEVVVRDGATGAPQTSLFTDEIRVMDAVWHKGRSLASGLFVVCAMLEPRDVVVLKWDTDMDSSFREVLRLRHCAAKDVAIASTPHSAIAALLFDDRCDLVDVGQGRTVASAVLSTESSVLVEGPWGSRFLAGDRVHALPQYAYNGEYLSEVVTRQPIKPAGYGGGDLDGRQRRRPRSAEVQSQDDRNRDAPAAGNAPGGNSPELPIQPYIAWSGSGLTNPVQASDAQAGDVLKQIVATEGPLLAEFAYLRYVQASGGRTVSTAVKRRLNPLVTRLVQRGEMRMIDDSEEGVVKKTLYQPGTPSVVLRRAGGRRPAQVPSSELRLLLQEMEIPILGPGAVDVLLLLTGVTDPTPEDIAHLERTVKGYRWRE